MISRKLFKQDAMNNLIANKQLEAEGKLRKAFTETLSIAQPEPADTHPLQEAFDAAIRQATKGKGVRHGGCATPFFDQPWYSIAKQTGVGGLLFQSMKKIGESISKDTRDAFERELLGGIAYAAMAYLYIQKQGLKGNDNA